MKKITTARKIAVMMSRTLTGTFDFGKPEIQQAVSIALCEILKEISAITGNGATGFLEMYLMSLHKTDKERCE